MKKLTIVSIAISLLFISSIFAMELGKKTPQFSLIDSEGKTHNLSDYKDKYVVLEWVNYDCPFVKKHYSTNNMQNLQKKYTQKGVIWLSICSSADSKQGNFKGAKLIERIKKEGSNSTAYLIDEEGKVGKSYGAKTTPHMFIINPDGRLIYSGGIDDTPSTDPADIADAQNYVNLALDEALSGKEVSIKYGRPYGCSVKYKKN